MSVINLTPEQAGWLKSCLTEVRDSEQRILENFKDKLSELDKDILKNQIKYAEQIIQQLS